MSYETEKWPFVQARWFTPVSGKRKVRLIVMHSMESPEKGDTAENVANYLQRVERPASAHICVDSNSIVQCVKDNNVAYGAPGVNKDGIHVELAGRAAQTETEWLDAYGVQVLSNAANAVAQYCLKYGIPVHHLTNRELKDGKRGIIGHLQATAVYPPNAGHTDPGRFFPWTYFLSLVESRRQSLLQEHK